MKRKHMPGCGCCCPCSPLGLHLELGELGSISIPFVEGQSDYSGSVEIAGEYSDVCDVRAYYTQLSGFAKDCTVSYPTIIRVFSSTVSNNVIWKYRRLAERIVFEYDFTVNRSTCKLTGTISIKTYIDEFHKPDANGTLKNVHTKFHRINPICTNGLIPTVPPPGAATICDITTYTEPLPLDYEVGDSNCCVGSGVVIANIIETESNTPIDFDQDETLFSSTLIATAGFTANKNLCEEDQDTSSSSGDEFAPPTLSVACPIPGGPVETCDADAVDRSDIEASMSFYYA